MSMPSAAGGDVASDASSMLAANRRADPAVLVQLVNNMKKLIGLYSVHFMEENPQLSGELSRLVPQLNRITAQAQKGANVNAAIRPIQMGAAQPSPPSQPAGMSPAGGGAMGLAA